MSTFSVPRNKIEDFLQHIAITKLFRPAKNMQTEYTQYLQLEGLGIDAYISVYNTGKIVTQGKQSEQADQIIAPLAHWISSLS